MADISTILKNNGSIRQPKEKGHYEVAMIHYSQIHPSKMQFYLQEDIEEQADAIELAGGILQPLVVRQQDADQYELLAGHRRLEAIRRLVEDRKLPQYAMVPCHVDKANDWRAEYLLITTNSYREKTGYEKMLEVQRLSEIIPHLPGSEELKGRALRGRIAKELKTGETSVQNYNYIYNHLCAEGMEAYRSGDIKTVVAIELAHLEEEDQKILLKTEDLTVAVIAEYKKKKPCQNLTQNAVPEEADRIRKPTEEERELLNDPLVSNSDTDTYVPYEESMVLYGKDDVSEEDGKNHSEEEEKTARKMIARYVKWAPERMKKVIALCNTGKTNKERAQSVQQYLAPDGTSGGGDGNFDFCFRGYANGVSFALDKNRLSMSYIRFVKHLEDMFGPFASEQSEPGAEDNRKAQPTIEQKMKLLREIIRETQEKMEEVNGPWQDNQEQLWKNQLILQAAEHYLRELQ